MDNALLNSQPLSDPAADLIAKRFRVMGEPMRIKLLCQLRLGSATVRELAVTLGAKQQNVSKHLGILREAGIVDRQKEGTFARYKIADESVFELCEQVCNGITNHLTHVLEFARHANSPT